MLKTTLKLVLVISLFCSVTFAGVQGNGGFADDGEMTTGGIVCVECVSDKVDSKNNSDDSFMEFIREFFNKMIG